MKNTFSTSINNKQCIGPCTEAYKSAYHPLLLRYITEKHKFCPTNLYEVVDNSGNKKQYYTDECDKLDKKNNKNTNLMNPDLQFDHKTFLSFYYNLYKYDDCINWITKNKILPITTRIRIIECIFITFFNDIVIIDNNIIDCYHEYFTKFKFDSIYDNLNSYLSFNNKKIIINDKNDDNENNNKYKKEKTNFIIEKLLNKDEITKFFNKYLEKNKKKFKKNVYINNNFEINFLLKSLILYLINKLKKSI
jgi:hypothetical protein